MPNPKLLTMAARQIEKQARLYKQAVQPPGGGGDPSMGGPPPGGDPSMGGMPPGGDPSMGGMPPGGDPSMGGGAPPPPPPAAPPPPPDSGGGNPLDAVMQKLDQMLQTLMQGPAGQAGPGGSPGGPGKPGKPDLLAMSMDIFQMKKYLFAIGNAMGIEPPPEIMDGPNRDPSTGSPMMAGAPGSTSDPATMANSTQPGQGQQPQSAIKPVEPMQGAMPTAPGGAAKSAGYNGIGRPFDAGGKGSTLPTLKRPPVSVKQATAGARSVQQEASALAALFRAKG